MLQPTPSMAGGKSLRSLGQLLTPSQRAKLVSDLAEMADLRRKAYHCLPFIKLG